MQKYENILQVMVRVARGCGDMMCRAHAGTIESETKSGFRDLVTRYDKEIQKYAVQQLAEAFPDAHFICEEGDAPTPEAGATVMTADGQKLDFSRAHKSSVVAGNAACIEAFCAE